MTDTLASSVCSPLSVHILIGCPVAPGPSAGLAGCCIPPSSLMPAILVQVPLWGSLSLATRQRPGVCLCWRTRASVFVSSIQRRGAAGEWGVWLQNSEGGGGSLAGLAEDGGTRLSACWEIISSSDLCHSWCNLCINHTQGGTQTQMRGIKYS